MELKIRYDSSLGRVPAAIDWQTSELVLNPLIWDSIPQNQKDFILLHEEGHWELKTRSEFEANKYAIERFVNAGSISDFGRDVSVLIQMVDKYKGTETKKPYKSDSSKSSLDPISNIIGVGFQFLDALGIFGESDTEKAAKAALETAKIQARAAQDQAIMAERASKTMYTYLLIFIIFIIFGVILYKIL